MGEYGAVDLVGGWDGDLDEPGVRLTQAVMFPRDTTDLPTAVPVFIGWAPGGRNDMHAIATRGAVFAQAGDWPSSLVDCLLHYFDNGGGPCWVFTGLPMPISGQETLEGLIAGWTTLIRAAASAVCAEPTITLVAMPQLVYDAQTSNRAPHDVISVLINVWQAALNACATRKELFFVLDAPADPNVAADCIQQLRDAQRLGVMGAHAALYGPHLVTDYRKEKNDGSASEDGFRVVAPCGAVLGVYGRTDSRDGVWKAPANEMLSRVIRPQVRETQARGWFTSLKAPRETETLSINLIRSFAGRGTRIWGCRTLAAVSADGDRFRYVQVRRTVSWIESNLRHICQFAVHEPNNAITWFQLRGLCNAWLRRLWLAGGLAGAEEAEAYQVLVGLNDSMTAEDVAAGFLKVKVSVALQLVAELIDVSLVLKVGELQTGNDEQEQET